MITFGLMGPGRIARKFADACRRSGCARIGAVASSSAERAENFASEFGIPRACTYEELLADETIQAVYVSTINPRHAECIRRCLEAGKAVLCEKPLCMSRADAEELCRMAEEKGILLAEAMWTLSLPCVRQAKRWIEEGRIGEKVFLQAAFAFHSQNDPDSRLLSPEKGGGGLLDVGVYTHSFLLDMAGAEPEEIRPMQVTGPTGVDIVGSCLFRFPGGVMGQSTYGVRAAAGEGAKIIGTKGSVEIPYFWKAREARLLDDAGNVIETCTDPEENGFVYEIKGFAEAMEAGLTEMPAVPHALTLAVAGLADRIAEDR